MKNFVKVSLLGLILAAALILGSCSEKGGTIEVTNELNTPTYVIIVKGAELLQAFDDLQNGKGELIDKGNKKTFTFDEDGIYTVVAMPPITFFTKTVTLALGSAEKVTVK